MSQTVGTVAIDLEALRQAIQDEYTLVADQPEHGFHFLVGRPLAQVLGYDKDWLHGIPEPTIASFAGTGNPFSAGPLQPGERVVDVGCGGGIDSYAGAEQSSSAANFGTLGVTFRARKAVSDDEWQAALLALSCELPQVSGV